MKMEAKEIAVRLYENKKYGTTYGKGLFHSAVFNGSADVLGSNTKYLLDYYPYERFEHTARTDEQMGVMRELGAVKSSDLLFSWVVQYNPATKHKSPMYGVSILNMKDNRLALMAGASADDAMQWNLTAKPCKERTGCKSPTLLATNAEDLDRW
jgi:hypothetical protein